MTDRECLIYLLDQYDRLVNMHELLGAGITADPALLTEAIDTFRTVAEPIREHLAAPEDDVAWDATQWRLYTLLRAAASGLVTRHCGDVWFEGAPANLTTALGVAVLDQRGLLLWIPDAGPGTTSAVPNVTGDALLRRWDLQVFGPSEQSAASSRPLTCLDDHRFPPLQLGEGARLLLEAIHACDPDETDGR